MNDGTKVQIKSEKTPIAKKFFHDCGQKKHTRKRLRFFLRKKSNIILSFLNKVLSLHLRNCQLDFAICKRKKVQS